MSVIINDLKHLVKTSATIGFTTGSLVFVGIMINGYTSNHKVWQDYAALGAVGSILGSLWLFKESK